MIFRYSELSNINEIPKTIILVLDTNEKILESCGKQLSYFNLKIKKQKLASIFPEDTYISLKSLLNNKSEVANIYWQDINFEVSSQLIPNSKARALYFFDITKYSNIENELKKSMHDLVLKKRSYKQSLI